MSSGEALRWKPVIGTMLIDSTPPARTMSCWPSATEPAAMAIACRPLEQNRLMVTAEVSTGSPPSSAARRATLRPCSPSGMAQPSTTSSTMSGLMAGTRSSSARMTLPASSSGRVARRAPLCARPTADRTASTMTTSRGESEVFAAMTDSSAFRLSS
jgi:hypothetical protein